MKRYTAHLIILFVVFAFSNCSKKTDPAGTPKASYSISGLNDITVPQYGDNVITPYISVAHVSGPNDTVSLAVSADTNWSWPITISTSKGLPPFSSLVNLRISKSKPGSYPVTITSSTTSASTQSHTFNVIVTPNANCAAALAGDYTDGETKKPCTLTPVGDKLLIPTEYGTATATLNCEAGTLTISSSDFKYGWLDASRTTAFNADSIRVDYNLKTPGHHGQDYDELTVRRTFKRKGH